MFEADLALKCLTFGVRLQGEQVVDHPSQLIDSLPQMMSKEPDRPRGPWTRIWIVNDVVRLSGSDGVIRVDSIKMAVRARHQVVDRRSNTGLRDVDTDPQSMEARFARRLSERYDELAESEAPALARATEVAKAIAIARWLRDNGAKLDVNGLVPMLNAARVPTVSKITALNVTKHAAPVETLSADGRSKTISQHSINIFGGVDMQVKPQVENNPSLSRLARAVVAAMPRQSGDAVEVRDGDRRYLATALPFRVVMAPSAGVDAGIRARYGRGLATR